MVFTGQEGMENCNVKISQYLNLSDKCSGLKRVFFVSEILLNRSINWIIPHIFDQVHYSSTADYNMIVPMSILTYQSPFYKSTIQTGCLTTWFSSNCCFMITSVICFITLFSHTKSLLVSFDNANVNQPLQS